MPETAKEIGLEVTEQVDERYHIEKATQAACNYLKSQRKTRLVDNGSGSIQWRNNRITKQVEFQKSNDYYDLWLSEETSRYIFRILALKEIMKNPEKYGYAIQKKPCIKI